MSEQRDKVTLRFNTCVIKCRAPCTRTKFVRVPQKRAALSVRSLCSLWADDASPLTLLLNFFDLTGGSAQIDFCRQISKIATNR